MYSKSIITVVALACSLAVGTGCDDKQADKAGQAAGETESTAQPLAEDEEAAAGDEAGAQVEPDIDKPEPGWDVSYSGKASGEQSDFLVLVTHQGEAMKLRLRRKPGAKGPAAGGMSLFIAPIAKGEIGEFEAGEAVMSFPQDELSCKLTESDQTRLSVTVDHYEGKDFWGSFEGTLQCEPREGEKDEEAFLLDVSGHFVDY